MARRKPENHDEDDANDLRYRAPALEKGLDIIELLASAPRPLSPKQISERLNRSVSELFRMVQVLEKRGYVAMAENQSGYELTNKLFSLAMSRGVSKNLLDHAIPVMRSLAENILQACHIVVVSDDQIVVVGQMDAPGIPSFHIRVGYRQNITDTASGAVFYAFQSPKVRKAWRTALQPNLTPEERETFEAQADRARAEGHLVAKSQYADSITDICSPIFSDNGLVAALTIPYIKSKLSVSIEDCVASLKEASLQLSTLLGATPGSSNPQIKS
ncbi:IclR family transcriptional regulator [Asticcacaulis sp. SL142]|uniref:IclR family transcriptional regulator n=1 Tax=Asticcacaulis sp. SL142 TaxID=2995155 RepID=UPI00226CE7C8|nr:IclR family transcriptional regulator [Asticcacaulis sp. SL142]WAC46852.1 IclR family transcriptional regulator [Asticcacaulis sp. SL142]